MKPLYFLLLFIFCIQTNVNSQKPATESMSSISFRAAVNMMLLNNPGVKAAEMNVELARRQTQFVNASWYPTITMTGNYLLMSEKIGVTQEYAKLLEPIKEKYENTFLVSDVINYISNELGDLSFNVPILDNNFGSVDLEVLYPIFTGVKRIYAHQLAKDNETMSEYEKIAVGTAKYLELADVYFSLSLTDSILKILQETHEMTNNHYKQALKMEKLGMFDKAERLVVKVALDESDRNLKSAEKEADVLRMSLMVMIGLQSTNKGQQPKTSTPLFLDEKYPSLIWFKDMMRKNAFIYKQSELHHDISKNTLRISKSNYFPIISVFGKQTIASYQVPKNLMPSTIAGVNMTWDIFDGLARERNIQQIKIESEIITETQLDIKNDLDIAVDEWYAKLMQSTVNAKDLQSSLELSEEVYKIRKKAFSEGLATSQQVLDALNLLNKTKLLLLTTYYEYDIALAHLCCLCGIPEYFESFIDN